MLIYHLEVSLQSACSRPFFKKKNYFWLHWVLVAVLRVSPAAASRHYSLVGVRGLLIAMASLVVEYRLQGMQASVAVAQGLQSTGLVAPRHVGVLPNQGRTGIPCIARQILNHWTTWSALQSACSSFLHILKLNCLYFFLHRCSLSD